MYFYSTKGVSSVVRLLMDLVYTIVLMIADVYDQTNYVKIILC